MHTKKADILEALSKIPELRELDLPVERLPNETELKRATDVLLEELQHELNGSLSEDWREIDPQVKDASVAIRTPNPSQSKHTTIRIPDQILAALHDKARELGIGYQTLIIRLLRKEARSGFSGLGAPRL